LEGRGGCAGKGAPAELLLRTAFYPGPRGKEGIARGPTMLPPRLSQSLDWAALGATTQHWFLSYQINELLLTKGDETEQRNRPAVLTKPRPCYQYHITAQFILDLSYLKVSSRG